MLSAWTSRERVLARQMKVGATLGGDGHDLEPALLRQLFHDVVRVERLPLHDGIGENEDGRPTRREDAVNRAQAFPEVRSPALDRVVPRRGAHVAARANLARLERAGVEAEPAETRGMVARVIVDARVRGRADDEIDASRRYGFEFSRVVHREASLWRGFGNECGEVRKPPRELFGLVAEESDGKSARQPSRRDALHRVAGLPAHLH